MLRFRDLRRTILYTDFIPKIPNSVFFFTITVILYNVKRFINLFEKHFVCLDSKTFLEKLSMRYLNKNLILESFRYREK